MTLTWDNAKSWQEEANRKKENGEEPEWSWDCGFKLDFDGPLMSVESRFYPPHKNSTPGWEGSVRVSIRGMGLCEKSFQCNHLHQLRSEVEDYISGICGLVDGFLRDNISKL